MKNENEHWSIGNRRFTSRLLHCFGDIGDSITCEMAVGFIRQSETDFLTVYTHGDIEGFKTLGDFPIGYSGLRFGDIKKLLPRKKYTILVNINHATTSEEAIKRAETGSGVLKSRLIKLEVLNDELTRPVNEEVIKAAKDLIKKGFEVLPLINADLKDAKGLERGGCGALRIIMSDIGSERGLVNKKLFTEICSSVKIPVIAEGGLGGPEDAYNAMVSGASAVLVNKLLFSHKNPLLLIESLKESINAGRDAFICNQQKNNYSPIT